MQKKKNPFTAHLISNLVKTKSHKKKPILLFYLVLARLWYPARNLQNH